MPTELSELIQFRDRPIEDRLAILQAYIDDRDAISEHEASARAAANKKIDAVRDYLDIADADLNGQTASVIKNRAIAAALKAMEQRAARKKGN